MFDVTRAPNSEPCKRVSEREYERERERENSAASAEMWSSIHSPLSFSILKFATVSMFIRYGTVTVSVCVFRCYKFLRTVSVVVSFIFISFHLRDCFCSWARSHRYNTRHRKQSPDEIAVVNCEWNGYKQQNKILLDWELFFPLFTFIWQFILLVSFFFCVCVIIGTLHHRRSRCRSRRRFSTTIFNLWKC